MKAIQSLDVTFPYKIYKNAGKPQKPFLFFQFKIKYM